MLSFVVLGTVAAVAAALIIYYYRTIGAAQKRPHDFSNDGQLHLIYPES